MTLENLQHSLDYRFDDAGLLHRALVHRSYGRENNERLEYLGDGALNFVIADFLFRKFAHRAEGDLTRMRASLVRRETLAEIALPLGIGAALSIGAGEARSGGRQRASLLANALEAVIGAVYVDGGFGECRRVVRALFARHLASLSPDHLDIDPKTRLQEFLQKSGRELPEYTVEKTGGEPHCPTFEARCIIPGVPRRFSGEGPSHRIAEQQAARRALAGLQGDG